jgi:hypothetical protein
MKPNILNCGFCFQNALKLTYRHLQFLKSFRGLYPGPPLKGEGAGFGREGEDKWVRNGDKGGRGKGREGRSVKGRDRGLGRKERKGWMRKGGAGYGASGRQKGCDAPGCGKMISANVTSAKNTHLSPL